MNKYFLLTISFLIVGAGCGTANQPTVLDSQPESKAVVENISTNSFVDADKKNPDLSTTKYPYSSEPMDGLIINDRSNLVWGNSILLTRNQLIDVMYKQYGTVNYHRQFSDNEIRELDSGFVTITKYLRDKDIIMHIAEVRGCEGCYVPVPTYLVINSGTGIISYGSLDRSKSPYFFARIDSVFVSPDGTKGAYVQNENWTDNTVPEIVWVIDFLTGKSEKIKELAPGYSVFEYGGGANEGDRLRWNKETNKLIINPIKK